MAMMMRGARAFSTTAAPAANAPPVTRLIPGETLRIHQMLENHQGIAGTYSGDHAAYHAISEAKMGKKLNRLLADTENVGNAAATGLIQEWQVPNLVNHLNDPRTREHWDYVSSLDPYGMESTRPTISATPACMEIPELFGRLKRDGKIVNDDDSINILKVAIDPVWNLKAMSEKLGIDLKEFQEALYRWTQNDLVMHEDTEIYLPSIGGTTVYLIGDLSAIHDPTKPVALRPHDECNGSDVFGTDICTCRPYLVYGIEAAAQAAQEGGLGALFYYRKEGRALGEVTKFRVYNARAHQEGGDRSDTYFGMTEQIAGVIDARAQELMPDPMRFMGIGQIDRLLSMSKDKHDAIVGAGINIVDRVPLPEDLVPKNAHIEINAKISSGYLGFQPTSDKETQHAHLLTLESVRERCNALTELGIDGKLNHFDVDMDALTRVTSQLTAQIQTQYPSVNIPAHSRMRHFEAGSHNRVAAAQTMWQQSKIDSVEQTRRMIDLVIVAVILDAGAGADWRYTDNETKVGRSEGLGLAAFDMFMKGSFSSDGRSARVDSEGLRAVSEEMLRESFQVSEANPLVGVEGRINMLHRLAGALENSETFTGEHGVARPGLMLDHIMRNSFDDSRVSIRVLWSAIMEGIMPAFPDQRGLGLGDVWQHTALKEKFSGNENPEYDGLIPFHKLSQWMTYSLLEPLDNFGIRFVDPYLLTGLAEYRNGGLFVDAGVLKPRDEAYALTTKHEVSDEIIVEWRGLTVGLLEDVAIGARKNLNVTDQQLPMGSILEAGTWSLGRKYAYEMRPQTGDAPITFRSDGNVF